MVAVAVACTSSMKCIRFDVCKGTDITDKANVLNPQ